MIVKKKLKKMVICLGRFNKGLFMPYFNEIIFKQYERMGKKGKDISGLQYSFIGDLNKDDADVVLAFVKKGNNRIKIQAKINNGIIEDIKFRSAACTIVMASTNIVCADLVGMKISDALELTNEYYLDLMKVPKNLSDRDNIMIEECIAELARRLVIEDEE